MKKSIAVTLLAATLMFTGCSGSATTNTVTESEKTEETTTTTTEETTEETTEATTESTVDERMLKMSLEEVVEAIKPAYTDEELRDMNADIDYDGGEHLKKDAEKGIKKWARFGFSKFDVNDTSKTHLLFVTVYEMDMDSEAYKSLKVGDTISPMIFSTNSYKYSEEENVVAAINGQYVLSITEMYADPDNTAKLITVLKAPYKDENFENFTKAFEALKNS